MANCETTIQRIVFDLVDPQVTKVTVEIDFKGDCPFFFKRKYEKAFPSRYSAVDLMTMKGGVLSYLEWQ